MFCLLYFNENLLVKTKVAFNSLSIAHSALVYYFLNLIPTHCASQVFNCHLYPKYLQSKSVESNRNWAAGSILNKIVHS